MTPSDPMPAEASATLKASIELTLPAATVLLTVMVVAAPAAGVKMKVAAVERVGTGIGQVAGIPEQPPRQCRSAPPWWPMAFAE